MSRLANGPSFELDQLVGRHVRELLGATESDSDELIEVLFLRFSDGDPEWHRLFLDAGIGFWEKMPREKAFYDYGDMRLMDLAGRWQLRGTQIVSANCVGGTGNDSTLSRFSLVMKSGTLSLAFVDSGDLESGTAIRFTPALLDRCPAHILPR